MIQNAFAQRSSTAAEEMQQLRHLVLVDLQSMRHDHNDQFQQLVRAFRDWQGEREDRGAMFKQFEQTLKTTFARVEGAMTSPDQDAANSSQHVHLEHKAIKSSRVCISGACRHQRHAFGEPYRGESMDDV